MRKRHVAVLSTIVVGALVGSLVLWGPPAHGQGAKKKQVQVETKAAVKDKREYPDQAQAKNSPEGAAGLRTGANACDIVFRNNTRWWIHRVYIDGQNVGQMAPWGRYILEDVIAGTSTLYAEADFTDGSVRYWGPRKFDCPAWRTYTWALNP